MSENVGKSPSIPRVRTCLESRSSEAKTAVSENRNASVQQSTCVTEAQEPLFAASRSRESKQVLAIETAGIHPSTGLCFEAMQWLHERQDFRNILDMGCGNGILAVAAAAIWDAKVLAVDISKKAINDARKNIMAQIPPPLGGRLGGGHSVTPEQASPLPDPPPIGEGITLLRSDGFSDPLIHAQAPYDLIICNMLAEFTVEEARQVKALLADGGICILAGILSWKAETVKTVYTGLGFEIIKEITNSPWQSLLIQRPLDSN